MNVFLKNSLERLENKLELSVMECECSVECQFFILKFLQKNNKLMRIANTQTKKISPAPISVQSLFILSLL